MSADWTDERVEALKRLFADGLSAKEIAAELGDVTRNAVIGKVHRLGLSSTRKPVKREPRPRPVPKRPVTVPAPALIAPPGAGPESREAASDVPVSGPAVEATIGEHPVETAADSVGTTDGVTIIGLRFHHCRWIEGDPNGAETVYCGRKRKFPSMYCAEHHKRAHTVEKRREDPEDKERRTAAVRRGKTRAAQIRAMGGV